MLGQICQKTENGHNKSILKSLRKNDGVVAPAANSEIHLRRQLSITTPRGMMQLELTTMKSEATLGESKGQAQTMTTRFSTLIGKSKSSPNICKLQDSLPQPLLPQPSNLMSKESEESSPLTNESADVVAVVHHYKSCFKT